MRSSEFLNEAGRDGAAPMTDAEFAAQQAQGAKNWDSIKGVGRKIASALGGGQQAATPYPDAATARASLSPEQLKWLGNADPMDPIIMARLKKAVPDSVAAPAAVTAAPAAATPAAPAAATPAATPVADAVAASGQPDDVTGVDAAVAANAAQATTPPAKAKPISDPKVLALQQQLIAAGAKIKADGIMGPATRTAQKQFGGNQSSAETARLARQNTAQAATPLAAAAPRPSIGLASQLEWDRQYAKTHNANGTPKGAQAATPVPAAPLKPGLGSSPMRESNFEESVNRMRSLSTLLKG